MPAETGSAGQATEGLGLSIQLSSLQMAKIPTDQVEAVVIARLYGLVSGEPPEIIHGHHWLQPPTRVGEEVSRIPFGNSFLTGTAMEVLAPTGTSPCVVIIRCVMDDANPRVHLTSLPHPWKVGRRRGNGFRGSSSDNRRQNLLI